MGKTQGLTQSSQTVRVESLAVGKPLHDARGTIKTDERIFPTEVCPINVPIKIHALIESATDPRIP